VNSLSQPGTIESRPVPIFLWDGECGVCFSFVRCIERNADREFRTAPYQSVDLRRFSLTRQDCQVAAQWLAGTERLSGSDAIAAALMHCRWPLRPLGAIVGFAPVRPFARIGYQIFARYRRHFGREGSCGTGSSSTQAKD
jgi:predicted DCC family thiol-disulfide oxidoreductase YuxK